MKFACGTAHTLPSDLMERMARFRHQVFVEQLGWKLQTPPGLEVDEFDRADTQYIIAVHPDGRVVGVLRLLPTVRPYLLAKVLPQLLGSLPPPCSPDVWELSRFAALDPDAGDSGPSRGLAACISPLALQLLERAMQWAREAGIKQLISASPLAIERMLACAGIPTRRAAPPVRLDGQWLYACWFDLGKIRPPCAWSRKASPIACAAKTHRMQLARPAKP